MSDPGPSNVFCVSREIWDSPNFRSEPYCKRAAWIWLCGAAAFRPHRIRGPQGHSIELQRGEFCFSLRFLAEKWGWKGPKGKSRAERVLNVWKKRDMIRDTSRDGEQVYLIRNYNSFQFSPDADRDTDRDGNQDAIETASRQHRDKEEEGNNGSSVSKDTGAAAPSVVRFPHGDQKPAGDPEPWRPALLADGRVAADVTEKQLFDFGKRVLKTQRGGLVAKLLRAKRGDVRAAMQAFVDAEGKSNPQEYLGGIINSPRRTAADVAVEALRGAR